MAATVKIPTIFTAVDKYSRTVNKMSRATNNFAGRGAKNLARMERRVSSLTPSFRGLNNALGGFGAAIGGALIVGAVGNAINTFAEFEQSNARLSSVMSSATEPQLKALSENAKSLGSTTSKTATEVVGLQEAYARLGFSTEEILNVTEATIAGSVAMNGELAETAELTGAMIRTFDDFSSADAPRIMDQMTVATQSTALNFEKLQTALPIVAGAANAAGVSFTETQAILGKLSDAGIDASSSATALRNIFIESAKQGLTHNQILDKIANSQDKLTASNDQFGKRAAVSASIISNNLKEVSKLNEELMLTEEGQKNAGAAQKAADKQLDTLKGSLTILGSAYEGLILSVESGNGALGNFLKTGIRVATVLLSLANGSDEAMESVNKADQRIVSIAKNVMFFGKALGVVISLYVTANIALKAWRIGLIAFNVIQGISTALMGGSAIALRGSAIAMRAYAISTAIASAAAKVWAVALNLGIWPITLIALGIAALIALVTVIIKKWDEWGAVLSFVLGPLGMIISLIQSFRRNWDMIVDAFSQGGIVAGLKAIGVTIIDAVLMPLQQALELASNLPGVGELAATGAAKILEMRENLNVNTTTNEAGEQLVNPEAARQESANRNAVEIAQGNFGKGVLTIENQTENDASFAGNMPSLDVLTSSTQSF